MKKMMLTLLALCMLSASAVAENVDEPLPAENLEQVCREVWEAYRQARLADPLLLEETTGGNVPFSEMTMETLEQISSGGPVSAGVMTFGDAVMRYAALTIGEKPENGYPLYIALHGGGGAPAEVNDEQWEIMAYYYANRLSCGVYAAPRGVRDTWDTHFNPESYPLYDRLIEYMILTRDVDPNRVYLLGFSAGGDGVYAVAPRMADRFAGVNMSSGHPNGISLLNLKNLPIQLQAGEYDRAYNRNTVTAEYDGILDGLEAEYGGYAHRTLIHYNCGHNYKDYKREELPVLADHQAWLASGDRSILRIDSFPPVYMDAFTRDPLPRDVIWDLSTRASERTVESFYYLSAPQTVTQGVIRAGYDRAENRVTLRAEGLNGDFCVLLNEKMVDFDRPIVFDANGETIEMTVMPSRTVLEETTAERGDPNYQFEARIFWSALQKQANP